MRYHSYFCVLALLSGFGYCPMWFMLYVYWIAFDHTGRGKYTSKDMMDLCWSRPLIIGWSNHIKNNCFMLWLPERMMSCDLKNVYNSITWSWGLCYYELEFFLLKWLFWFLHSKTNMPFNIAIKISISNVPDMLLAVICTTTVVE